MGHRALTQFAVQNFRNIEAAELQFSPQLNLFTGDNGAGKTSLLEALYVLGRGQSFRTSHPGSLIRNQADALLVRGILSDTGGSTYKIGVRRDPSGLTIKANGQPLRQLSELASLFPFQVINPDSHRLLEGGPSQRRRYLDWGVFHVEPGFFPTWRRYSRALRQRNAALRAKLPSSEVRLWDDELHQTAEALDHYRSRYLEQLLDFLAKQVEGLVDLPPLRWEYRRGWSGKQSFIESLTQGLEADRRQGFTRGGPHRADLVPLVEGGPAQERLSRGQQKQLVAALILAQAQLYQQVQGRPCLFLVDDLPSELDPSHRARVLNQLRGLGAQVFLTAIEPDTVDISRWADIRRFHVEHGVVQEVVY